MRMSRSLVAGFSKDLVISNELVMKRHLIESTRCLRLGLSSLLACCFSLHGETDAMALIPADTTSHRGQYFTLLIKIGSCPSLPHNNEDQTCKTQSNH